jgi:ADP-ribose pyrophosphatase YjhB (NUDIX family)
MSSKHLTASVFVFAHMAGRWRLALLRHPRYGKWMVPGGHVEAGEHPTQTARREVAEETGLAVRLLVPPSAPPPSGQSAQFVAPPWWIVEEPIPAGTEPHRQPSGHIHVDALYVALADQPGRADSTPDAERVTWWDADALGALEMFEGTRRTARWLLARIDRLAAAPSRPQGARGRRPAGASGTP